MVAIRAEMSTHFAFTHTDTQTHRHTDTQTHTHTRMKLYIRTLRQLKRDKGLFPPLRISPAGRNVLKNLPRQIFSACVKFGGNPCRDVDTLHFYTHTHTQTHTQTHTHIHK